MITRLFWSAAALIAVAAACGESSTEPTTPLASFVVEVSGEEFRVHVTTEAQASDLRARLASGVRGVISGDLLQGTGGFNMSWRWHLRPSSVHIADVAIELCDGRPSLIEADLIYWLVSVQQFCPWGAKVVREE